VQLERIRRKLKRLCALDEAVLDNGLFYYKRSEMLVQEEFFCFPCWNALREARIDCFAVMLEQHQEEKVDGELH